MVRRSTASDEAVERAKRIARIAFTDLHEDKNFQKQL
jgi:hypothetical protein